MRRVIAGFDWVLFSAILILTILGLVINGFLVPKLFSQQLFYIFLGLVIFFLFSRIDYRIWEKLAPWLYFGSLLFLLTPFLFGALTRGVFRWIQIGNFSIQPSEIVKPFLIVFFAYFFSRQKKVGLKEASIGSLAGVLPFLLIFFQPDLGSSLVVLFSWLGILFASGVALSIIFGGFLIVFLSFPLIWKFLLKDYQRTRMFSFLKPLSDPLGAGYNVIQATIAVGTGQLIGRGLGRGTQSHLRFLPERHTDFIFASLAEDLGFLGVTLIILTFFVLLWRIIQTAGRSSDIFGRLICLGVFTLIFSQVFINMGMNLGLLPITGVTLPLVSYGGSSFVATMISLGIVENIYLLKKKEEGVIIGA